MIVLYIEDDAVNRQVMRDMLHVADAEMIEAGDAETGLRLIDEHDVDVVLVDLRMAGVDGLSAVRQVRQRLDSKASLPLIVVTADTSPNLRDECVAAGADDLILKPVAMRELFDVVGRVIAAKSNSDLFDL